MQARKELIRVIASSSAGNAYVLDGEILLDAGVPIRVLRRALRGGLTGIRACLLTHEHGDHAVAVRDLMRAGIDVYASPGTWEALGGVAHHRMRTIDEHQDARIGDWEVSAFPVVHDAAQPLGFRLWRSPFEHVLYLTDTGPLDAAAIRVHPRYTHVIIEANHDGAWLDQLIEADDRRAVRVAKNHLSIEAATQILADLDLEPGAEVWLAHLSSSFGDEVRFAAAALRAVPQAAINIAPERAY